MRKRKRVTQEELQKYFEEWLDINFTNGLIKAAARDTTLDEFSEALPTLTAELNRSRTATIIFDLGRTELTVQVHDGSDPDEGRFNLFEIKWSRSRQRRKLLCFLGHRYLQEISNSLRKNLAYVLQPSNIQLIWSNMDLTAQGFFSKTIHEIRRCDFCIFDNRAADEKPNVYIEAGIAYVLNKPFIMANYAGNRLEVPSDLLHINTIQYSNYRDLMKEIYFGLPIFLRDSKLRTDRD